MNRRVLLIEDHSQNRYLLTFLLERNGFQVESAVDGPEGIAMARNSVPDLILLDIQLPTMSGYEVASELRVIADLQGIPIVAVTSHAMVGDREKALAAGCAGYIEKPINPDTFISEIQEFLAPSPAGDAL